MRADILLLIALWSSPSLADQDERIVPLTQGAHVYFTSAENRRAVDFTVDLPGRVQEQSKVMLHFKLSCPAGRCDAWDRAGTFGIVQESPEGQGRYLELMRFMTPYGIGESWVTDVTDFMPLLRGTQRFRVFIDTWVGPGHANGNGWLVDADLELVAGEPALRPTEVVPVLSYEDIVYGDPARSTSRSGQLPGLGSHRQAKLKMVITGHGQGNAQNCAEFCAKEHSVTIGDTRFARRIWRDDCARTVNPGQAGNWRSPRAGWCPGDQVFPWEEDATAALSGGATALRYDVEAYDNTCRPNAPRCSGCVFGTSCNYDGGLHTEPRYYVTSYVVYYD